MLKKMKVKKFTVLINIVRITVFRKKDKKNGQVGGEPSRMEPYGEYHWGVLIYKQDLNPYEQH